MLYTINRSLLAVLMSFAIFAYAVDAKAFDLRKPKSNAFNVAILDKPSVTQLEEIGYYRLNYPHKPFFDSVVIFAANINLREKSTGDCKPQEYTDSHPKEPKYEKDPNQPCIYYNQEMQHVLEVDQGKRVISMLQRKGIKVQLGILNNHEWAGWSCKMEDDVIHSLAQQMVDEIVKFNLDGIMIDDEYSDCSKDPESFYNLVKSVKDDSRFAGKIITKALFHNGINGEENYFKSPYNLATLLDQGYEMSYSGLVERLERYEGYGMDKKSLGLGVWYGSGYYLGDDTSTVYQPAQEVMKKGYGGMMIYQPQLIPSFLETATYFSEISRAEYSEKVFVYPHFPIVWPKHVDRIWRP